MTRALIIIASLVSFVCTSPDVPGNMLVHEHRDSASPGFVHVGAPSPDVVLSLRLGLTQSNFTGLEKALYAVSTPGSDQYTVSISPEQRYDDTAFLAVHSLTGSFQVNALVAPCANSTSAVKVWLSSHSLTYTPTTPAGDWFKVTLTVAQANRLLGANFATFKQEASGKDTIYWRVAAFRRLRQPRHA